MTNTNGLNFLVDKKDWGQHQFAEAPLPTIADDEVLFAVDRFALTANNISYALSGDMLGYWNFFPAPEGLGRIPVMGYGDVIESKHAEVAVGTRCFGFFPMSRHLKIKPGRISSNQILDGATHRKDLATAYNQYSPVLQDPLYDGAHEDSMLLLRGLFMTSFLADDALREENLHGAHSILISSASSKTSVALAYCVSEAGRAKAVGLTSARNLAFVKSLGCYDTVVTYDEITSLDNAAAAGLVDMAGNGNVTHKVHAHWADRLKFSMSIGATHWQAARPAEILPGPTPEFFFAPAQIAKRIADWGASGFQQQLGDAWHNFRRFSDSWLQIQRQQGPEALAAVYREVLTGESRPEVGHILSLADTDTGA